MSRSSTVSEYTQLFEELIKLYESIINDKQNDIEENLANENITWEFALKVSKLSDEEIDNFTLLDLQVMLEESGSVKDGLTSYKLHNDPSDTRSFIEWCKEFLKELRDDIKLITENRETLRSSKEDILNITNNYIDKLRSPEYREARLERIKTLRKQLENETDDIKKKEMSRDLDTIEKSQNFTCILDRLRQFGDKEASNMIETFFDKQRGDYILKKYFMKLEKLEIPVNIHNLFMNIEEKLLPERYAPFNNFFIYAIIRYVSYCDTSLKESKILVTSLLAALRDVLTDKATKEEKFTLVGVINEFYTYFDTEENIERFKKNNSAYKLHPDRIKAENLIKEKKELVSNSEDSNDEK